MHIWPKYNVSESPWNRYIVNFYKSSLVLRHKQSEKQLLTNNMDILLRNKPGGINLAWTGAVGFELTALWLRVVSSNKKTVFSWVSVNSNASSNFVNLLHLTTSFLGIETSNSIPYTHYQKRCYSEILFLDSSYVHFKARNMCQSCSIIVGNIVFVT